MLLKFTKFLAVACTLALGVHCSHKSVKDTGQAEKLGSPVLTKAEAEARAKTINQVDYSLDFDFSQPGDKYTGRVVIQFQVIASGRDLRIDFADGEVSRMALNGKSLSVNYNKRVISIPGKVLKQGLQRLEIDFAVEYSRNGRGLAKFVDPVDKNVYLYSDFEPYDANRAFPCFDQPDLKATYSVKVTAPKKWEVITSVRESSVRDQGEVKVWDFPRSARYSTYIFPLHAGNYAKWEDKNFRYPLRLFARQSLAKYVKPAEWFPISRHGFDFFESFFGYLYPYKKYDQIIVPEFNAGAMENVAAVTFTERFISRGPKANTQVRGQANTILHEMAHMWFGNLVTMRWWGDLWLNEAFATYTSFVAQAAYPEFKDTWQAFFGNKTWAYWEDQMITTHPIVAQVKDTNEAFTSFDGITYGKGSAVLKQLSYYLGEESFKKGLKIYFERYAEKNTEYKDFMGAMAEASGKQLEDWQKAWFETAGLNALSSQFECKDGRISQFVIQQTTASGEKLVRPHATQIALMNRMNGKVEVVEVLSISVTAPTTYVPAAIGKTCPHIVYLNHEDYGYVKSKLDTNSANFLKTSLYEIQDPLLRQELWYALWDKVRDAELPITTYADMITQEALPKEQNELILRQLLNTVSSVSSYYNHSPKLLKREFPAFSENVDKQIWARFKKAKAGSNEQLIWLDSLPKLMTSSWGMQKLVHLLNGSERAAGMNIDQDRRWEMVNNLARHNDPEAPKWIQHETKRDNSSMGVEKKIGATAALPPYEEKTKWIDELKKDKSEYSFAQLRSAIGNLFPYNQIDKRELFSSQFFKDMLWVNVNREHFVAGLFSDLAPAECSPDLADRLNRFVNDNKNLQPVVVKDLKITSQEGERCRKIITLGESNDR